MYADSSTSAAIPSAYRSPGTASHDRIGPRSPAARSASASSSSATPSQLAPPRRAARPDSIDAVPVAVGLDDRHHVAPTDMAPKRGDVGC